MNNLFDFEYQKQQINNLDGTKSRFSTVYGQGGNVINCPKDSYKIVPTAAISTLGNAFIEKGMDVKSFTHRSGEVIGLNVALTHNKVTKIGDKNYNAIITMPNNGNGGKGFLSIKEKRLICTNGQVRTKIAHKESYVKVPHSINYQEALDLMKESLVAFESIMGHMEEFDQALDGKKIDKFEAMRILNEWYYSNEMPDSHKKDMSMEEFRRNLATTPETIKSLPRYHQLIKAFNLEQGYNKELSLDLSYYTCFASVTNYLSRRQEFSGSKAPQEIQLQRSAKKLEFFEAMV